MKLFVSLLVLCSVVLPFHASVVQADQGGGIEDGSFALDPSADSFWSAFSDESAESYTRPTSAYSEAQVLKVTSDSMEGEAHIMAVVDAQKALLGLRFYDANRKALDLPFERLQKGVVLLSQDGFNVITLKAGVISSSGGQFDLAYLTNGITKQYGDFYFNLVFKQGGWVLVTPQGKEFTKARMESRTFFGKVIGIKRVIVE